MNISYLIYMYTVYVLHIPFIDKEHALCMYGDSGRCLSSESYRVTRLLTWRTLYRTMLLTGVFYQGCHQETTKPCTWEELLIYNYLQVLLLWLLSTHSSHSLCLCLRLPQPMCRTLHLVEPGAAPRELWAAGQKRWFCPSTLLWWNSTWGTAFSSGAPT